MGNEFINDVWSHMQNKMEYECHIVEYKGLFFITSLEKNNIFKVNKIYTNENERLANDIKKVILDYTPCTSYIGSSLKNVIEFKQKIDNLSILFSEIGICIPIELANNIDHCIGYNEIDTIHIYNKICKVLDIYASNKKYNKHINSFKY